MNLLRRAPAVPVRTPTKSRSAPPTTPSTVGRAFADRVSTWLYDTRVELKKVVWPTREQAINLTGLVIAVALAVAAFIGVVDAGLEKLVQLIAGG
jgi:preprotein translocase subunit SecE